MSIKSQRIMDNFNNKNNLLFYKIWKNHILKNHILNYINKYNIIYGLKRSFESIVEFENYEEKNELRSIEIKIYENKDQFLKFIKELPRNIESLEIIGHLIVDIKELILAPSIKNLKINNEIIIKVHKTFFGDNHFSNIINLDNLVTMVLGKGCSSLMVESILPRNLKKLTICFQLEKPIKKGTLPETLESLEIKSYYRFHDQIYLPNNLKSFKLKSESYGYDEYNVSILDLLSQNLESLKMICTFQGHIERFNSKITKSIKKLTIPCDVAENSKVFNSEDFPSLTTLDFSHTFNSCVIYKDKLPKTLKKLKLWRNAICKFSNDNSKYGYPSNITNFEGWASQYSDLPKLNLRKAFIDYNKGDVILPKDCLQEFENLESICYQNIKSLKDLYLPIKRESQLCIKNIECGRDFVYSDSKGDLINFSIFSNLKTLKLDAYLTCHFYDNTLELPQSLEVLDINLTFGSQIQIKSTFKYPPIKYLVIKGVNLPFNFYPTLPIETLEHMFLYKNSLNNLKSLIFFKDIKHLIRIIDNDDILSKNKPYSYLYKLLSNKKY